jgi:glucose-1-phosphate adenylyltransferase
MLENILTVVLAGGHGSRLQPLTSDRAKPAVPFGAKYRIIDFTLANCMHSGLRRVLVLTQYKSHSLHEHLRDGWSVFNPSLGEYITAVPPQMRGGEMWYRGTADAVQQNRWLVERSGADHIVILSGDHIYRMDYAPMIAQHRETGADVTIGCMQVSLVEASSFGVMSLNDDGRITEFDEKPEQPTPDPLEANMALVSMGIYVFRADALLAQLNHDSQAESSHDFGKDIIPGMTIDGSAYAYRFGRERGRVSVDMYWRDVGTIDSYFDANMDLLQPVPPLNLYQPDWAIRTFQGQPAPMRTVPGDSGTQGVLVNSMAAGGVIIAGGMVEHSILGPNVLIGDGAHVRDSILLGNTQVWPGADVRRAIIDKSVSVPAGTQIGVNPEQDRKRFTVSLSGIVVIPRGYRFNT